MKINNDQILGLEVSEDKEFSIYGCGNCDQSLGGDVYECKAHFKDDNGNWDHYDIELCNECICAHHNADELPENCKNSMNI